MTRPTDASLRQTIRDTWLKLSSKGAEVFRYFFPVAIKNIDADLLVALKQEHASRNDLLFLDSVEEGYSNLSRKTLAAFAAAHKSVTFKFALKVDDDSFVRLGALLKALKVPLLLIPFLI